MQEVTFAQEAAVVLPALWKWILAGCGMITALAAACAVIYRLIIKPWKDIIARIAKLEQLHADDQKRNNERFRDDLEVIQDQSETLKMMCHGMLVLLDHAATGNSVDKCKKVRDEMLEYLTEKK